jgi:hypothetical protein
VKRWNQKSREKVGEIQKKESANILRKNRKRNNEEKLIKGSNKQVRENL